MKLMQSPHLPGPRLPAVFFCRASFFASLLLLTAATFPVSAEEISEIWEVARVHSPPTVGDEPGTQETIITDAEEALRDDIPAGLRAFKLPQGTFIRFNPIANRNEPRDLSFAKTMKVWVHAESQAQINIRIAGRFLKPQEHIGGGWKLLEWDLESDFQEPALVEDQEKRQDLLAGVTLIDVLASLDEFGGDEVLISGLVAAE